MSALVLDCSITMAWCVESETSPLTEAALTAIAAQGGLVPGLWAIEVANVLRQHERRSILSSEKIQRFCNVLQKLPIQIEHHSLAQALGPVLDLSRKLNLSAYDAAYLELALRYRLPIATLDRPLQDAAKKMNVAVFS